AWRGIPAAAITERGGRLEHARRMGGLGRQGLEPELAGLPAVKDIRGMGLMLGVELDRPCGEVVRRALAACLVTSVTADKVIRLLPPLVIKENEARELVSILSSVVKAFLAEGS